MLVKGMGEDRELGKKTQTTDSGGPRDLEGPEDTSARNQLGPLQGMSQELGNST